jgi:serine/threonine protein kinase
MALARGTILGQYEIRSPVGAGGMGEVHSAHDTSLDREVAIKLLAESRRWRRTCQDFDAISLHVC